jgi:hypothetical protein
VGNRSPVRKIVLALLNARWHGMKQSSEKPHHQRLVSPHLS